MEMFILEMHLCCASRPRDAVQLCKARGRAGRSVGSQLAGTSPH
jgi:hypothetical protein